MISLKSLLYHIILLPPFVLSFPFCKLVDWYIMRYSGGKVGSSPEFHLNKVRRVQSQIEEWNREGRKQKMCTSRPGWKSPAVHKINKRGYFQVDLDDLNDVIEIDTENRILRVEPGVMMGQLSDILLPMGWTIPVIPEIFETLTVGGCVCGLGLESSGHKYGTFHNSCLAYEVVLPDGEVVICSKKKDPELFYSIPASFGTVGFLTSVTIALIPATKYVKISYQCMQSAEEAMDLLNNGTNHDFVEGIVYSSDKIIMIFGDMTNDLGENGEVSLINRWYKPFYYQHVESLCKIQKETTEFVPLKDYYRRHTRGILWDIPTSFPVLGHPLFLTLFGWVYPLNLYLQRLVPDFLMEMIMLDGHIYMDIVIPVTKMKDSLELIQKESGVYPLWLCPTQICKQGSMIQNKDSGVNATNNFVDIGIYGYPVGNRSKEEFIRSMRKLERHCIKSKGFQGLYADCYLNPREFREMFVTTGYDKARKERNCANSFPDVYDKISAKARNLPFK